ncbi:uncharacterized protein si:dkeyp-72g9.4 [Clupea harengus]|uniref:Uncharacterized protein si:dkeyp-72g9.4 n=1 Tax=Clupea harengus TaxID=7950 RepID=A0A6P8FZM1_CLUHA|nr:uncharacterized protein si:dkeyp-72g9.4 [Clupea harengus]XP_031428643.1 uncharacterized protein si:dkeyp-72g9.4 [Clupea harengus]
MRPRSRLLVKRGLPTIREGYEEMVQDMNQANSQHTTPCAQPQSLSTQDYLLSICQLARPTFPLREPDWDILSMTPMDMSKPCLRLHRHRDAVSPTSTAHTQREAQGEAPVESACSPTEPVSVSSSQKPITPTSDPLEYLYSNRGSECPWRAEERGCPPACRPRSGSFPRASAPPDTRRKSSCPELSLPAPAPASASDDRQAPPATLTQRSPLTKKKQSDRSASSPAAGSLGKPHSAPADWRGKGSRGMDKNNMVSHWIAECRSAWREAMIHACMLPALAEK